MKFFRTCAAAYLFGITALPGSAQDISLADVLEARLHARFPEGIPQNIHSPAAHQYLCTKDGVQLSWTANGEIENNLKCVIRFINVKVKQAPGEIPTEDIKYSVLPDVIANSPYIANNCTDKDMGMDQVITFKYTESHGIEVTTRISTDDRVTLDNKVDFKLTGLGFSAGQQETISILKEDATSGKLQVTQERDLQDHIFNIQVAPMTSRYIGLAERFQRGYTVFHGKVIVDNADMSIQLVNKTNPSFNPGGVLQVGKYVEYVPAESDRAIQIDGDIWNVQGWRTTRTDIVNKLAPNDPLCQLPADVKALNTPK